MTLVIPAKDAAVAVSERVRVMIVDDAIVVRGLFARWVEAEPDMEVVASLRSGRDAVAQLERTQPDVVVLDIDMPDMDGIEALPLLLAKRSDLVVIMASTLTRRNAEISLKALSLGATDYIPKPSSTREVSGSQEFHRDLIEKVRQLGLRAKRKPRGYVGSPPLVPAHPAKSALKPAAKSPSMAPLALRPMPLLPPQVLLIGASTGGPQALNLVMAQIGGVIDHVPVLITQHMPPTFTAILAEHLARVTERPVREAVDGEDIHAGTVYIAPGGKHMSVARRNGRPVIAIGDGAPVNFCKPAVDPLFMSAAQVWGQRALALVLTGMGSDGLAGGQALVAAGASVLAQDEASSVVWGMPGQVATAGLCSAVLPLTAIAPKLTRIFAGDGA